MRILVLGGSHFVGRALVEAGLDAGHDVTAINRGLTGTTPEGATLIRADRTDGHALTEATADARWDAVVDTWSGAPVHATSAANVLGERTTHYGFVSSRSVYTWPIDPGADESHTVVDGDGDDTKTDDYARTKRGSELGILSTRPDALIARPGLILGPYEDVGRLPWWLERLERGGRVLAPGPENRPLQYIDARDLAAWMIRCAESGIGGIFNTVSEPGHTTMGDLLRFGTELTGSAAELVWVTPEFVESEGVQPWIELPIWLPPEGELSGLHNGDVTAAMGAGLHCRPMTETLTDTWAWIQAEGMPDHRADRPTHGVDPIREEGILEALPPSA